MARATTDGSAGLELPRLVHELVSRAELDAGLSPQLVSELAALEPDAAGISDDARRLLALDLGWTLAAHEPDISVAARSRARLLAAAGDAIGAAGAWIEAAGLASAQGDHAGARADLDAALAAVPHVDDGEGVAPLMEQVAPLATALGHPQASACWQRLAEQLAHRGDGDAAAHALHQAWCACTEPDAARLLERGTELGAEGGWAARCAAVLAYLDDRFAESEAHAERALRAARRTGDRPLEAIALHGIACARSVGGDLASAITVQRQALAMAQAIGDARTLDSGWHNLVMMLQDDLRGDEALDAHDRMHAAREAAGDPGPVAESLALRASILHERGDLMGAQAALDAIDQLAAIDAIEPLGRAHVQLLSSRIGIDAGADASRLDECCRHIRSAAVVTGMGSLATHATIVDAVRCIDAGDARAACDTLLQLEVDESGLLAAEVALVLGRAGLAARRGDCIERARALALTNPSTARLTRIVRRELAAAEALLADGDHRELLVVADEWARRRRPIDSGRVLLMGAHACTDPRTREALAGQAARLLAAAGAVGPASAARQLLSGGADEGARPAEAATAALFEGVDAEVRDELLRHAVDIRRPQGSVLHDPDDVVDTLWVVRGGRVRLCRATDDERRLTVELLDPGSVLGEHALLGLATAGTLAECEEPVVLAALPIARVAAAMGRCPRLAGNLLQLAGARMERGRQLAERVAFWTVDRRMARCLLDLDAQYGRPTLDGNRMVDRSFTHFQLAELVNARRETVGEFLKRMRADGVIELRRRRIVVLDPAALATIVATR